MACLWFKDGTVPQQIKQGDVVALLASKSSDFGGKSINVSDDAQVYINPADPRTTELQSWYLKSSHHQFHPLSGNLQVEIGLHTQANLKDLCDVQLSEGVLLERSQSEYEAEEAEAEMSEMQLEMQTKDTNLEQEEQQEISQEKKVESNMVLNPEDKVVSG